MSEPRHWFPMMLRDELDMLECQLYEHYDAVHRFIVVEAPISHQGGNPKPLYYADNKERFAPYADKIIHVVCNDLPSLAENPDPWCREQGQRNAAAAAFMGDTDPDDIVIVADVDEIPSATTLAARPSPVLGCMLKLRFASLNWVGGSGVNMVIARASYAGYVGIDRLRQVRESFPVLEDGGWHFSWFGGQQAIDTKLRSFCHLESLAPGLEMNATDSMYRRGITTPGGGQSDWVDVDETYPRWVREGKCPAIWFAPLEEKP